MASAGDPDANPTRSWREQRATEESCAALHAHAAYACKPAVLDRERHVAYLTRALTTGLPSSWSGLDASRCWLAYWAVHSLDLLQGDSRSAEVAARLPAVVDFLARCCRSAGGGGGFGGGPGQAPHTASAYAAVLCLLSTGTREALEALRTEREALHALFLSLKHSSGGFCVQADGEADVRARFILTLRAAARTSGRARSWRATAGRAARHWHFLS